MKILILGSKGYLGKFLSIYLKKFKKFYVLDDQINKNRIDLTTKKNLKKIIFLKNPEMIINCCGMTNIDDCERKKNLSYKINVDLLKNIFLIKKKFNLKFQLIHFSTDQLYNKKIQKKNVEKALPFLGNVYSKQKFMSEKICLQNKSLIFRINLIGKSFSKKVSFTDWIIKNLRKKNIFYGFEDSIYSPISLISLSKIIKEILITKKYNHYGVFNLGSIGSISKYEFIVKFSKLLGYNTKSLLMKSKIKKICITKRSKNNQMNVSKFKKTFKINLPLLKSEIVKTSHEYK